MSQTSVSSTLRNGAKRIFHFANDRLPEKYSKKVDLLVGRKDRAFSWQEVNDFQLQSFSGAQLISTEKLVREVFRSYYGEISPSQIVPALDCYNIRSFTPFFKGKTGISIYNFHDRFYAVRDPLLYRFILVSEGRICAVQNFVLKGHSLTSYFDVVENLFPENQSIPETGSIVIQAFHPRLIRHSSGEHRFYALYRDSKNLFTGAVHSLVVPSDEIVTVNPPGFRNYGTQEDRSTYVTSSGISKDLSCFKESMSESLSIPGKVGEVSLVTGMKRALKGMGYYIRLDSNRNPMGSWHDDSGVSVDYRKTNPKVEGLGETTTLKCAFMIPSLDKHCPYIMVSRKQVGFLPDKISLSLHLRSGDVLGTKIITLDSKSDDHSLDLEILFQKERAVYKDAAYCIVDFLVYRSEFGDRADELAPQIMVFYRGEKGICDQLHSDFMRSRSNVLHPLPQSYRCLKFAPLIKKPGVKCLYAIANVGGARPNTDTSVYVRVLSDTGAESITEVEVRPEGMTFIEGETLLASIGNKIMNGAIVQLEHKTSNFSAQFAAIESGSFAIEHFTGN